MIDASKLNEGVYIAKVSIDNGNKINKLIKN